MEWFSGLKRLREFYSIRVMLLIMRKTVIRLISLIDMCVWERVHAYCTCKCVCVLCVYARRGTIEQGLATLTFRTSDSRLTVQIALETNPQCKTSPPNAQSC